MKRFLFLAALTTTAFAHAQVLYSTGFEAPTYTAGQTVVGVDGWLAGSGSGLTQTVSTGLAASGTQSLIFDNSVTTGYHSVSHAAYTGHQLFETRAYIASATMPDRIAEFALSASPSSLVSIKLGMSISGDGQVRAGTSWGALYSGASVATAAAGTFSNRWLSFSIDYNPLLGTGLVRATGFGTGQSDITASFTGVSTTGSSIHLATDYGATDATGLVAFDDFKISQVSAVPELASFGLLGLGAAALFFRRRR